MESVCFICNSSYWSSVNTSGSSSASLLSFCDLFGVKENSEREELLRLSVLTEPFCAGCGHKMNQIQQWMAQLEFLQKGIQKLKAEVAQLMLQSLPHSINIRGTYPIKARIVRMCSSSGEESHAFASAQTGTNKVPALQDEWEVEGDVEEETVDDDTFFRDEQNNDDDEDFNPVDFVQSESKSKSPSQKKPKTSRRQSESAVKQPRQRRLKSGGERIEAHEDGRCRLCSSTFKSRIQLWKHIRRAHSGITHPCRYCDREFRDTSNRKRHEEVVHLITTREFVCEQCGKDYKTKSELHNHIKVSHEGYIIPRFRKVPSQCQDCGKMFGNAVNLRNHRKLQHSGLEPVPCPICGRPVKGASAMHGHKKTHLSAWELKESKGFTYHYKCPICPLEGQLGFRSRDKLTQHYAEDHPDGDKTLLRSALKKAPARKNKRKYFCSECPHLAGFYWKSLLDAHVASGHQEFLVGPLSKNCRVCTKPCWKREKARRHEETHHTQVHVCSECIFTHPKKKDMEAHYAEDHPEIPVPEIPPLHKLGDVSDGSDAEEEDLGDEIKEEGKMSSSEEDSDVDSSANVSILITPRYSQRGRMINPSKHLDIRRCKFVGINQEVKIELERVEEVDEMEFEDVEGY